MRQEGKIRGTSRAVRARAKELRKEQTPAEEKLWRVLRQRAVNGLKFRRQHPLDGVVLDFFCPEVALCVELDGGIHDTDDQRERDAARTAHLEARGLRVIRFRNEEVLEDMPSVLRRIAKAAAVPSVRRAGGGKAVTAGARSTTEDVQSTPPPTQFVGGDEPRRGRGRALTGGG